MSDFWEGVSARKENHGVRRVGVRFEREKDSLVSCLFALFPCVTHCFHVSFIVRLSLEARGVRLLGGRVRPQRESRSQVEVLVVGGGEALRPEPDEVVVPHLVQLPSGQVADNARRYAPSRF